MDSTLRVAAAAKLNLYLHVTGKRPDNYHLLDGLVAFTDICDWLEIKEAESLTLTTDGPFARGLDDDPAANLVMRAASALADAIGRKPAVALRLTKTLPVASGIGGGSADAAACLRGLARLWGTDPAGEAVGRVAERLGADVPACVDGRACHIGGIGTELTPVSSLPPTGVVLVNPGIPLPTPAVYRARQGAFSPAMRLAEIPGDAGGLAAALALRGNDLTAAAISMVPEIAGVLAAIAGSRDCLLARMSGSGATCFGLFADVGRAFAAARDIGRDHPGWWVAAGRLIADTRALDQT
jgi:4-diphosphocytidyl-2-C-methyl-D-erythritol kinase